MTKGDIEGPARRAVLTGADGARAPRWRPGERLHHLFEERCDQLRAAGDDARAAVATTTVSWSYAELDGRANQLARHLLDQGVRAGDRVGLLVDDPVHTYTGMLAVLKVNAAYVPLDAAFPADRVEFIARDADIRFVLTQELQAEKLAALSVSVLCLDVETAAIAARSPRRLAGHEVPEPVDELCYVIYTSGSTGTPKGVAVDHASICNFVRIAAGLYGYQPQDRVYQGLTIAFDFSVEEIWVPWLVGATLVPKPSPTSLVGQELHDYLVAQQVTAMCCVPTLLTSLDEDIPGLRFLLVSGEACPQDLVRRWYRPGRRLLNVYGPTEATVTATWTTLHPDRPVTLGVPLPTYSVVILDPDRPRVLAPGEQGEIGIAGIGLARGYLNRPERTARSFIPDFLGLPNNPSGRIYRTGDLGTVNEDGEIEYHGRIDTQVKIRGYRIELTEIESVLLQMPGIAQAVVDTYDAGSGPELVAYYSVRREGAPVTPEDVDAHLRARLPAYMVPAYLERLAAIPLLPSDKADRKNLPAPTTRHRRTGGRTLAPRTSTEAAVARALAHVLGIDATTVSADSHFFDDFGADSLLLARLRAELRRDPALAPVSMREVYEHPTVEGVATVLDAARAPVQPGGLNGLGAVPPPLVGALRYALCGAGQLLAFGGYLALLTVLFTPGFDWIATAADLSGTYLRALAVGLELFAVLAGAPIVLKWVLVGRWKRTEIPLWGLRYLRFWTVRTLVRTNPLVLFTGSPVYSLYLRALGAKIGADALILTRHLPVCTDLLRVGAHAVVRKDALLNCYRAQPGHIQTGPVSIGEHAVVGEGSVLDIDTAIGDHGQLGHSSALHRGRAVPAGARWHGSPAEPTTVDYQGPAPAAAGALRKVVHGVVVLVPLLGLYLPVILGILDDSVLEGRWSLGAAPTGWTFFGWALELSAVLFFGAVLFGLLLVTTVPQLLRPALRPGRVHPVHGVRHGLHRLVFRLTNLRFFMNLFGDSVYIVHYLRGLGYRLNPVEQTGSNFGTQQQHDSPLLVSVGTGTMVSDGLSVINASYSSTSFRLDPATIGARNFLGNVVRYPAGGRTGDNCLLATKVMVPLDGTVHENVGLLGSPPFTIPRSVRRDAEVGMPAHPRAAVVAKTWHNTGTILVLLATRWLYVFGVVTFGLFAGQVAGQLATPPVVTATGAELLGLVLSLGYWVLVERAALGFRRLRPRTCSIYDVAFWRHERLWKLLSPLPAVLNGTPFKVMLLRLLGVRVGRRVLDDGCGIPEKTLVRIGDGAVLNAGSVLQGHSLEDGVFKSDRIVLADGVTVGVGAFVHYGVTIGGDAVLDADSFLMKGEQVGPRSHWWGNPAREEGPAVSPAAEQVTGQVVGTAARPVAGPGLDAPRPADRAVPSPDTAA